MTDFIDEFVAHYVIPIGYCQCGCGGATKIANYDDRRTGAKRGQPYKYIRNHHKRSSPVDYIVDGVTGCWNWQLYVRRDGYGEIHVVGERGNRPAHIVMYQRLVGMIPNGLDLDHTCRNRRCVNPAHLEPVTRRENLARGNGGFANFASFYDRMKNDPSYRDAQTKSRIKGRDERGRITNGKEDQRPVHF